MPTLAQLLDLAAKAGYRATPLGMMQSAQDLGNHIMDETGNYLGESVFNATDGLSPEARAAAATAAKVLPAAITMSRLGNPESVIGAGKATLAGLKSVGETGDSMLSNYIDDIGGALSITPKQKRAMNKILTDAQGTGANAADNKLLETFGDKFSRQDKAAKKVAKAADSTQEAGSKSVVTDNAGKVDPDYFRQMYNNLGDSAVFEAANRGEHLKRMADGRYVGGPRTVDSPQSLGAMRSSFDTQFDNAANAIAAADDPSRVGTWYDRVKSAQALSNEPHQLPRSLEQHAVYSAGVAPENELGFALKHLNSRELGAPEMAYRGAPMRNLDSAVAGYRPSNLAFKIGEYRKKNDPFVANEGPFGVNDFRSAQSWSYTDPQGNPWKSGVTATMHPFIDAETALAVQRANQIGAGGRTDWQGPHLQEMPWVLGKAEDQYSRRFNGMYNADKFGGSTLEAIKQAVRDANNTIADYFPKHNLSATWEAIPGRNTGHIPEMLSASPEEKLAYTREGSWAVPTDTAATPSGNVVGAGNRDALYSALNLRQLPSKDASGYYKNSAGEVETNPATLANVLMDFEKGSHAIAPLSYNAAKATERFRGLIDAQEAVAANLPDVTNGAKGRSSVLIDMGGQQATPEQMMTLAKLVGPHGFSPTATDRGVLLLNDAMEKGTPRQATALMKKFGEQLQQVSGGKARSAAYDGTRGFYEPALAKWGDDGLVPTVPGSGEATASVLQEFTNSPQEVARKLSESERVRGVIGKKMARDSKYESARSDVQKTREFFRDADWQKAVELIRQGMAPAAAVASLGYSLNGMAAEDPSR